MNAWFARNLLYRPAALLRGEPTFRLLRRYRVSQWWEPEELAAYQSAALARLLHYAVRRVPYYRDFAASAEFSSQNLCAEDLSRFPVITKAELVQAGKRLLAWRPPGTTSWKTTGGSTGVPVRLRKNRYATAAEQAASWRCYEWYGIRPGDRAARFWGTPQSTRTRLRYRAIDAVLNRARFSAFAFQESDLAHYFERLSQDPPVWVYGYVSMLTQFARYCLEEKQPHAALGVQAVVTTSEVLSESDRDLLRKAFGAPVYNEYGCGEVGAVLYECERGSLHLMAENLFVELFPDPTPEEPAGVRLVVTDLHNRALPLLRYDLADRAVPAPPCACGRALPAFSRIFGRAYDFVVCSDGTRYHGEFFLYALEAARDRGLAFEQAQFVQLEPDLLKLRIVPAPGYRLEHGRWIAERIQAKSGGRVLVRVEETEAIERERSGKIRLIVALPRPQATTSSHSEATGRNSEA